MRSQLLDNHVCAAHFDKSRSEAARASYRFPNRCVRFIARLQNIPPAPQTTCRSLGATTESGARSQTPHAHAHAHASAAGQSLLALGIDFGTSGARCCVVEEGSSSIVHEASVSFDKLRSEDWVGPWTRTLLNMVRQLPEDLKQNIRCICIDGTSSTALLVDKRRGDVLAATKLYSESQGIERTQAVQAIAPKQHTCCASSSTLCKLMAWHQDGTWQQAEEDGYQPVLLHQADWLASLLTGRRDTSDWNNALKLGFDPGAEAYPDWLLAQDFAGLLPERVLAPGSPIAHVTADMARQTGLSKDCMVCTGTTDSNAAFLAAGVDRIGEAVSSLGSTFAVKLLSNTRVDNAAYGIYSHRLGDAWLVGGASNTGGAVLKAHFTADQLQALSQQIDISQPSGLDYYPLTRPGERFPVNDPGLSPRLEPRPDDDAQFLYGMLEGIASIEAQAYALLQQLGAAPLTKVYTAGGGAKNSTWTAIRQKKLGVPVEASAQAEAAYGSALLALKYLHSVKTSDI